MAETTENEKLLVYLKKVSADLYEARERLRKVEVGEREPVAVIGMGCRFPGGVQDPDGLWDLVATGTDAISGFPENRGWEMDVPAGPAESYARAGGFITDIAGFDTGFFGISPREALATDPQQRLLLEVSWEALERAGLNPQSLRGSRTGVFVGGAFSGYTAGMTGAESEGYLMTGGLTAVMSGRVSYALGLEGPAVTLDTACSSSLVALHLACQSLRSEESTLALAGGVSLLVLPMVYAEFAKQQGMASDGRCKAFAGAADGVGWGEGVGMIALERLSDARRNGHPVLAVISGSAVNSDGASNGLTAPNGPSQRRVIRAALASARLSADQVDAVEGHGTGTELGDPIEAQALVATYGQGRPENRPLWLGSVKSNIGHTQSAAGVAGVMKMVLALQHGLLPTTLHVDEPSPHVDWSAGDIRLLTEPVPWPADAGHPRRAGVSAFGVSGTNAHLILEDPPAEEKADGNQRDGAQLDGDRRSPVLGDVAAWLVSARSADALAAQAGRLAEFAAARPGLAAADVAWSLATTRPAFEHRAVITGVGREELTRGLAAMASGRSSQGPRPAGVFAGSVLPKDAAERPVLVFSGHGAQWDGMGVELAAASPVFAMRLAECGRALAPHTGWELTEVLTGAPGAPGLDREDVLQPALWAVSVSLAAVWEAAGVIPAAVVGHSQGEIAAATVAGILSLADAARLIAVRGRVLVELAGHGAMLAVAAPAAAVAERLAAWTGRLCVAAVNGPTATVVSGERAPLAELAAACAADGIRTRPVPIGYASHSPQVERVSEEFISLLGGIIGGPGRVPMISGRNGEFLSGPEVGPEYWYASLRSPVDFDRAVRVLADAGHRVFIESSPHPALVGAVTAILEDAQGQAGLGDGPVPALVAGTLRRGDGGPRRFLAALAEVHTRGVSVDWTAVLPRNRQVELPTYAFQRERYWADPVALPGAEAATPGRNRATALAEARFWSAIEDGDPRQLAQVLAVGEDAALGAVLPALTSWRRRELEEAAVGDWRYRVSWMPVASLGPTTLPGTWLLAVPAGHEPQGDAVAAAMIARGAEVHTVTVSTATISSGDHERVRVAVPVGVPFAGVVSLLALDEAPLPHASAVPSGLAGTLGLIQGLGAVGIDAPLWALTSGAVGALPGEVPASATQAQVWGLGRAAGVELPGLWGGLVDLPSAFGAGAVLDDKTASLLCAALAGRGEEELAIRQAGAFARRLVRAPRPATAGQWRPRGTALVTGASGSIGPDLGQWLADSGAPRVVLTGRRGPQTPGVISVVVNLAAAGTAVAIAVCDVTDREQMAGLLAWAGTCGPPVSTVIHCAVAVNLKPVADTTVADLATALGAKAGGAALLDELLAEPVLAVPGASAPGVMDFVLFSSIAATWGVAEHGAYGAANAYLDALAQRRRARGLPATSVAWSAWSAGGKFDEALLDGPGAPADQRPASVVPQRLARQGLRLLDPARALSALGQVLAAGETVITVADVDWERFAPVFTAVRPWRLLDEIPRAMPATAAGPGTAAATSTELARKLAGLGPVDRERMVTALVRRHAAAVLGFANDSEVEPSRAFRDMGFDSLTAIDLRERLNDATGLALPSTVVFDYPSPTLLAREVVSRLVGAAPAASRPAAALPSPVAGDPVVIVGLGCRFPGGADTPEELWELLESGEDAIGGFPADRGWDMAGLSGTSHTREGGFVSGMAEFDAGFFGISPREALAMDPQQRLLLEVSWETLERAGIDPVSLQGSRTGVFVGAEASGYAYQVINAGTEGLEGHLIPGNVTSVISGRISYVLGLEGPAVTVDTACSSALVALHLAAQALRAGECDLALAGGVMVIADPAEFVGLSRQGALAPDGRCKAFAAAADGMGPAEGAGMIAVERLSDARRNGHEVLAVVAGSAVNQDGASNGLSAPNGPSQQRVIAAALANAGLSPSDVDVVEGHGTGTTLGDPIEAQAVIATYGQGRPAGRPLWLGSVKSNIGHTQQAAGAAAVIKMTLALQHGELPRTLHVDEPSPHVDWSAGQVRLLTEPVPWPVDADRRRRTGISSFGISGTNAHVIIEEPPATSEDPRKATGEPSVAGIERVLASSTGAFAWPVSGKSVAALAGQAGRLAAWAGSRPELDLTGAAWSLAATRSVFGHRAVVIGGDGEDLVAGLSTLAAGPLPGAVAKAELPGGRTVSGAVPPGGDAGKVVFVFPGQGSQWAGMGTELAESSPVFAARLAECAQALEPHVDWSLADVLGLTEDKETATDLERVDVVQPALWAVMVSLAAVWQAAGVIPDAVAGHSQGEIAAAVVAGVLSLEDGARVVALRSRALRVLSGRGGMASLAVGADVARARIGAWAGRVEVAAVNGPHATVVSGDSGALAELVVVCEAEGIRARVLPVDYASHGPQVEELEREIVAALDGLAPRPASIPMISALTGEYLAGPEADAGYWYASLRAPVEFQRAVQVLAVDGHRVFLEASPHPVLVAPVTETLEELYVEGTVTGTLRRDDGGPARLLTSLAEAYVQGAAVNWTAVLPRAGRVDLPTYAFQRQRYWPQASGRAGAVAEGVGAAGGQTGTVAGTGAEARFWAAVEDADLQGLADVLAVDGQQPLCEVLPALSSWRKRERAASAVESWRYRIAWVPVADPGPVDPGTANPDTEVLDGTWLLVGPAGRAPSAEADRYAAALAGHGAQVVTVLIGQGEANREALADRIAQALKDQAGQESLPVAGAASLLALDETPLPGLTGLPAGLAGTVALVQALGDMGIDAPLWVVTRGAVAAAPDEAPRSPVQAQCWGLGLTVALEHPDRWGGLIDLPPVDEGPVVEGTAAHGEPTLDEKTAQRLCAVLAGRGEDQMAIRSSGLLARRMTRADRPTPPEPVQAELGRPRAWAPSGTVLVTGGTGAIGGHVARWLTTRDAPRTVLASRSGPVAPGAAALAAALAAAGTAVTVAACDTACRTDLAGLLDRIAADQVAGDGPPLTAIFHAAGIAPGQRVSDSTPADLAGVLGAKATGAARLDELTSGLDLEAFVLFSSGAAAWGSANLGAYAAASAYLDALAGHRRGRGLRGTSIAWGGWGGGGMADSEAGAQLRRLGLRDMDPELAITALAQALDDGQTTLTVADVDWTRFAPVFTLRRPSPLISGLPEVARALRTSAAAETPPDQGANDLATRLAGLPRAAQDRVLTDLVRAEAATVLGYSSLEAVEPARAFKELGFDSVTAVELRNRLRAVTGLTLPATLIYNHPSSAALAASLRSALVTDGATDASPILAEIAGLESALRDMPANSEIRDDITRALRGMLSNWMEAQPVSDASDVAEKSGIAFELATPDQVFDFLDKELGIPGSL
jgi:acyl transferase domain-containing protein/acyl carrier protein